MTGRVLRPLLLTARDFLTLAWVLPATEIRRRRLSLHDAVASARRAGGRRPASAFTSRARLRRIVSAVDRRLPDGGNCVRRALVEMAMDPAAAQERFFAGLTAGGGPKSGHAWLETDRPGDGRFDAIFTI
ncbi:MAG TPA: lasso peptide biosynthesis protein [Polyangia bacterium]|nr:lasso peptide biosynthesis protein [Polyangia bacterium]